MATPFEEQLLQWLGDAQSRSEGPRKQAELNLLHARTNEAFPISLAAIAGHASVATATRQSALTVLRRFVEKNWGESGLDDDEEGGIVIPISDATKDKLRTQMLELATNPESDRQVRSSASYVVSKIAAVDYPEQWPTLLPTLLHIIPSAPDAQLHGALKVLADLVEDALSEDQFFSVARDIIKVLYDVVTNPARKLTLKALAVSILRGTFEIMDMVKDEEGAGPQVKAFADETLNSWLPFFLEVLKSELASDVTAENIADQGQKEEFRGPVALKLQVVKTLMKIRGVFPQLLLPHSPALFAAIWAELSFLQTVFEKLYINASAQGKLEDSDGLAYTLDFLILEELDFLQSCLRAPPVQKELEAQIQSSGGVQNTPWIQDVMKLAVGYARIPSEEEALWEIDPSLFIAEETSITTNYIPRTACGDLLIKLGEWLHQGALEGLLSYTKGLFASQENSWKTKEASLYLATQLVVDFIDVDRAVPAEVSSAYLEFIDYALNRPEEGPFRARGHLLAGILAQTTTSETFPTLALLDRTIKAINDDEAEVVKIACIKALQAYLKAPGIGLVERQIPIATAISEYLNSQDLTDLEEADELPVTLVESLRSCILLDTRVCIHPGSGILDLLFLVARHGVASFQLTMLVNETFQEIVQSLSSAGSEAYTALCEKVLPSLTGALDIGTMTENNSLTTLATELLAVLTENGSEPLPRGFVAAAMPKLNRLLMSTNEGEVLRPGVESVKFMLMHDHQQVFAWQDENGRSGLEVCLLVIDRLLAPAMEDNSASEVGGLAAELVEKAGHDRLGPFLPQLLLAVATRLASAEAAPFIQSLILVFARLSLVGAQDVVEFLSQSNIGGQSGLQVVMSKWLEHSINFAGYDEIRQNVIALSKLYQLNDARLAQTLVKGDLIIPTSDRIMTRSKAKQNPDKFTIIPAQLKIIKVLIEELLSASGVQNATTALLAAEFADEEADDDGWEDVPSVLDLGSSAAKADLMAYGDGGGSFMRERDDETQSYLTEFFVKVSNENTANFHQLYNDLTDAEKEKLSDVVHSA